MIPCIINNRDLLHSVQQQIAFFNTIPEAYVIVCDNASTYPPLLEWYASALILSDELDAFGSGIRRTSLLVHIPASDPLASLCHGISVSPCKFTLFRFPHNRGPRGWGVALDLLRMDYDYYFISDADLDYSGIDGPTMMADLRAFLNTLPPENREGVGVSLRLDDLPPTQIADYARHVESRNWPPAYDILPDSVFAFRAPTDTAGVLRRRHPHWLGGYEGWRSLKYTARHIPWYFVKEGWQCPDCKVVVRSTANGHSIRGPLQPGDASCQCREAIITPPDFQHFYAHASPSGTCYTARVLDTSRPLRD